MAEYIAECFWAGVSERALDELDELVRERTRSLEGVSYRGSMLVPEDEVVFCFFEGASADAVRNAAERANVPFARIVESTHFALRRAARP